jgi:hypothetical protein
MGCHAFAIRMSRRICGQPRRSPTRHSPLGQLRRCQPATPWMAWILRFYNRLAKATLYNRTLFPALRLCLARWLARPANAGQVIPLKARWAFHGMPWHSGNAGIGADFGGFRPKAGRRISDAADKTPLPFCPQRYPPHLPAHPVRKGIPEKAQWAFSGIVQSAFIRSIRVHPRSIYPRRHPVKSPLGF